MQLPMNIIIRKAVDRDKQEIAEVFSYENRIHTKLQPEVFMNCRSREILGNSWFDDVLSSETSSIHIAEVEELIVGVVYYTIVRLDNPIYRIDRLIKVQEMVVVEEYQGMGVGRMLLDHVEQVAQESGIHHITLQVWENNVKAIRFYQKLGFDTKEHILWKPVK